MLFSSLMGYQTLPYKLIFLLAPFLPLLLICAACEEVEESGNKNKVIFVFRWKNCHHLHSLSLFLFAAVAIAAAALHIIIWKIIQGFGWLVGWLVRVSVCAYVCVNAGGEREQWWKCSGKMVMSTVVKITQRLYLWAEFDVAFYKPQRYLSSEKKCREKKLKCVLCVLSPPAYFPSSEIRSTKHSCHCYMCISTTSIFTYMFA